MESLRMVENPQKLRSPFPSRSGHVISGLFPYMCSFVLPFASGTCPIERLYNLVSSRFAKAAPNTSGIYGFECFYKEVSIPFQSRFYHVRIIRIERLMAPILDPPQVRVPFASKIYNSNGFTKYFDPFSTPFLSRPYYKNRMPFGANSRSIWFTPLYGILTIAKHPDHSR